ncbi:MAG: hypothetical protein M3256_13255 [Actinomycetota bacterium]|nr:hypothetical protein [Actinomycetota bacterium]
MEEQGITRNSLNAGDGAPRHGRAVRRPSVGDPVRHVGWCDRQHTAHLTRPAGHDLDAKPLSARSPCDAQTVAANIGIEVAALRLVCNKVLDAVAAHFGPKAALADDSFGGDHYWRLTPRTEAAHGSVAHRRYCRGLAGVRNRLGQNRVQDGS